MTDPAHYNSPEARLDTVLGGDISHYVRLQRCLNEFQQQVTFNGSFDQYLLDLYGLQLINQPDGDPGFQLDFRIEHLPRYLLFLLKFSPSGN